MPPTWLPQGLDDQLNPLYIHKPRVVAVSNHYYRRLYGISIALIALLGLLTSLISPPPPPPAQYKIGSYIMFPDCRRKHAQFVNKYMVMVVTLVPSEARL